MAIESGKKTSLLILRLRVIAASPTGILAFSSMTRYSQPCPPLYGDDVEGYLAHGHGAEAVLPARVVEDAALDDLPRDDLFLARLEPAQEHVDGAQTLGQAGFETFPVRGGDDAGDPIRRMGLVALLYAERVLLVEQQPVRLAQLLFPPLCTRASQLVEDRLVDPTQRPVGEEDLVCARECALEPHRLGIILAPWQGTLCRADGPRPDGSGFWAKTRRHGYPKSERAMMLHQRDARRCSEVGSPAPSVYSSQQARSSPRSSAAARTPPPACSASPSASLATSSAPENSRPRPSSSAPPPSSSGWLPARA